MANGGFKFIPKKTGLAALLEEEKRKALTTTAKAIDQVPKQKIELSDNPMLAKERIAVIFDDSGSMGGQKIIDACEGTIEFMRNCVPNETACAVYCMNYDVSNLAGTRTLTTDLPKLSALIAKVPATNYTPLFQTMRQAIATKQLTRLVVFSDGIPDDKPDLEPVIELCKAEKIPCDCVYIESSNNYIEDSSGARLLKQLAEETGGYFLLFKQGQVDFKSAFKYLAPKHRLRLADGNFRKALEAGEIK